VPAGAVQPRHAGRVALPELRLTGAEGGDGAYPLVAQDHRQLRLERPVAVVRRAVTPPPLPIRLGSIPGLHDMQLGSAAEQLSA
jgi:hypothetical protein